MLGEGIFTQDGRPWKHSRELLRRQFVRINFKDLSTFDRHVDDLVAGLSSSDGIVDLQPAFFRFTLATTTALIFGESVSGLGSKDHEEFASSFDYASMISAIRLRLADLEWAYKPKPYRKACDTVKGYASHFVNEALKAQSYSDGSPRTESQALIQDLYAELQNPELVRDQLVHVLIAGRDTTACLMSWTLYVIILLTISSFLCAVIAPPLSQPADSRMSSFLLVRHPRVLDRLRQEIESTLPKGERLTRAHLQRMTYLRSILNESRQSIGWLVQLALTRIFQLFDCTHSYQSMSVSRSKQHYCRSEAVPMDNVPCSSAVEPV